jgi:hypothetical protein
MNMTKHHLMNIGAAMMVALAGCGGGGTEGPAPDAPVASPMTQAMSPAPVLTAPPPLPQDVGGDRIDRLQGQLDVLRRHVEELQRQVSRLSPSSQVTPPQIDESPRDPEQEEMLRMSSSESAFRDEPVDAGWSRSAVASVRTALAQGSEGLASRVQGIDCRSKSCRVIVSVAGEGADEDDTTMMVDRLAHLFPNAAIGRSGQGDGQRSTVLYLSR